MTLFLPSRELTSEEGIVVLHSGSMALSAPLNIIHEGNMGAGDLGRVRGHRSPICISDHCSTSLHRLLCKTPRAEEEGVEVVGVEEGLDAYSLSS